MERPGKRDQLPVAKATWTRVARCVVLSSCITLTGCGDLFSGSGSFNPFRDLVAIPLDGVARDLRVDIIPLGAFGEGIVLSIEARGTSVEAVLILTEDESTGASGQLVGGGPANERFSYRVPRDGRYFAKMQFAATSLPRGRRATIAVRPGDLTFTPPDEQRVLVRFDEGFLTAPGLMFDKDADDENENQEFLLSIADQVREGIAQRLETIFAGTPITLSFDPDNPPAAPYSTVTIAPDRVLADPLSVIDAAFPPPPILTDILNGDSGCGQRVIFGKVLSSGALVDPGNQRQDDDAVVYVGSFQGDKPECQTAITNSLNNIVLGLSHTAAHEIGHLVGLYHVALTDVMQRSPTLAFQRELSFQPGQIVVDSIVDGSVTPVVFTTIKQDPHLYFSSIFLAGQPE